MRRMRLHAFLFIAALALAVTPGLVWLTCVGVNGESNLGFDLSNGAKHFRAEAKDTDGHVFQHEWNVDASGI